MRTFWSKSNTVSAIPVFILCTHTTNVKLALAQRGAHRDHNSTCALVLSEYRTCKMSIYAQQKHSSSYSRGLRLEGGKHFYSMCATFFSLPCPAPAALTGKSLFHACYLYSLNALLPQSMVCWPSRSCLLPTPEPCEQGCWEAVCAV